MSIAQAVANRPGVMQYLDTRPADATASARRALGGLAGGLVVGGAGAILGNSLDVDLPGVGPELDHVLPAAAGAVVGRNIGDCVGRSIADRKDPRNTNFQSALLGTRDNEQFLPKMAALNMSPLPHQQRLSDTINQEDSTGQIAMHGLGTGKTFSAINAAQQGGHNLLAVTPASLRNNMRKEISDSGFSNPSKVVSYQEALNKASDPAFQDFARNSLMAIDESHALGHADSARSQLPDMVQAKKKLFLTGTPIRNNPEEIAPLVNALEPGALPNNPKDFRKKFTETRTVPVGFWGRLKGISPGKETVPIDLPEFEKAVKGKIDYHENVDRSDFPSHEENIIEVPMGDKQQATYNFVMGKYPRLAYKVKHGIPLNKNETKNFQSFMSGPRQVANHPGAYNASATDGDAPKIKSIADQIEKRFKGDKNYRGVTYSSYLESGAQPVARELDRRKIPYQIFSGAQDEKERKKIVENYNEGKIPHLIITKAGAEGLDLKGTKLMQITEPHWNEELINQARGRAIRYKSHAHLPEKERHVEVQRFHSAMQPSWWDRLLRRDRASSKSADEFIYNQATAKKRMNEPFLRIMRGDSAADVEKELKSAALDVVPNMLASMHAFAEETYGEVYYYGVA